MVNKYISSSIWLFGFAVVFFSGTVFFGSLQSYINSSNKFLAPPPEYIEHFHFGFRDSIADSLWLRWIQDSDFCQTYKDIRNPVVDPQAKAELDPKLLTDEWLKNPRHKDCDQSWTFKMLDAVTKLAMRFKMAYLAGAVGLSVLVEDYIGASVIFERGLSVYPDDWQINYRAAYHFLYDRKDLDKAAKLLIRASDSGGPEWLKSLASRLYSKMGQVQLGLATLKAYREMVKDKPNAVKDIDRRIQELEAQLRP